jgi:hypothetical protein
VPPTRISAGTKLKRSVAVESGTPIGMECLHRMSHDLAKMRLVHAKTKNADEVLTAPNNLHA